MFVCIEFECRGLFSTAAASHGDGACCLTGRGHAVNFGCINVFTGCGDNFFFFLDHFVTDGAIGHKGVRAVLAAGCGDFVFFAGGFGVGNLVCFGLCDRHNTAGFALFTLGQACCRAGSCLGFELDELFVIIGIEFKCCGLFSTAAASHGDGACGLTGGGHTVTFGCVGMFEHCDIKCTCIVCSVCGIRCGISSKIQRAGFALLVGFIALGGAGSFVGSNRCTEGVAESCDRLCCRAGAELTGLGLFACGQAIGLCGGHPFTVGTGNDLLMIFGIIFAGSCMLTVAEILISIPFVCVGVDGLGLFFGLMADRAFSDLQAGSRAGGSQGFVPIGPGMVFEFNNNTVKHNRAVFVFKSGVALCAEPVCFHTRFGAGGIFKGNKDSAVIEGIDRFGLGCFTDRTFIMCRAACCAGGGRIVFHKNIGMRERFTLFACLCVAAVCTGVGVIFTVGAGGIVLDCIVRMLKCGEHNCGCGGGHGGGSIEVITVAIAALPVFNVTGDTAFCLICSEMHKGMTGRGKNKVFVCGLTVHRVHGSIPCKIQVTDRAGLISKIAVSGTGCFICTDRFIEGVSGGFQRNGFT